MSLLEIFKKIEEPVNEASFLYKINNCFIEEEKEVRWIFRGQKKTDKKDKPDNEKPLITSLEKAIDSFGIDIKHAPELELGLLRKFKRHGPIYLKNIPVFYDYMGWFSLMQHYGAPTRLQDWTYSFYVAVYMAINEMEDNAEVWAINTYYIERSAINILKKKAKFKNKSDEEIKKIIRNDSCAFIPEIFKDVFMNDRLPFVLPMNPHSLNERLIIQQGIFLCPGDVSKPFYENLFATFSDNDGLIEKNLLNKNYIRRFNITNNLEEKKKILQHLHRMNMNNATLFPGLSGFSESLRTLLAFPLKEDGGMLALTPEFVNEYLYSTIKCNYKDIAEK